MMEENKEALNVFQNVQIELETLPTINALEFLKPAPAYLKVKLISTALFFLFLLIPVIFLIFFGPGEEHLWVQITAPSLWLVISIVGMWLSWKGYKVQGYALREKDINYKKGVIIKTTTSIPFNRVQHCEIKQGPVARQFGLSTLEVFTAGGQSSDLTIPGITPELAQQLKEFIINKTNLEDDRIED